MSGGSLCVGPASATALERHRALGQPVAVGRDRPGERAALGAAVEPERPRHVDLAELLGEALDPAAHQGEVVVDPDVRAGRDGLAVEQRVHDDEELLVLPPHRLEQLVARRPSTTASRRTGRRTGPGRRCGSRPGGRTARDGVRVGPVLDARGSRPRSARAAPARAMRCRAARAAASSRTASSSLAGSPAGTARPATRRSSCRRSCRRAPSSGTSPTGRSARTARRGRRGRSRRSPRPGGTGGCAARRRRRPPGSRSRWRRPSARAGPPPTACT